MGKYLNTPFFYGGEYEWHGSKIDTLELTKATVQSQAKASHVDFKNSGMEKLFLLLESCQMKKTQELKSLFFCCFLALLNFGTTVKER